MFTVVQKQLHIIILEKHLSEMETAFFVGTFSYIIIMFIFSLSWFLEYMDYQDVIFRGTQSAPYYVNREVYAHLTNIYYYKDKRCLHDIGVNNTELDYTVYDKMYAISNRCFPHSDIPKVLIIVTSIYGLIALYWYNDKMTNKKQIQYLKDQIYVVENLNGHII